ncbi:cytochrome P450 [Mycena galericulata]|nr:cytochrome P450 [Mycena galericulata]
MLNVPTTWNFHIGATDAGIVLASVSVCFILLRRFSRRRSAALKGPSSNNFFFGVLPLLMKADSSVVYEEWAAAYGSVFSIPHLLGSKVLVLTDPKALQHFFSRETYGYVQTPNSKRFLERLIGRGLFWAEGDSHKRQRRALNPAFSNASIKNLTPIFFDSAYKAKAAWDALLESSPSAEGAIIEVQQWMNHISLDTIGLAGFSHDFGALSGKTSAVATAFDSIGSKPSLLDTTAFLLSLIIPYAINIPTGRRAMLDRLQKTMRSLGDTFMAANSRESTTDKSVIGLLVQSASTERISEEEVLAQISVLLLAGYETTAISLTWALIEVSRNPTVQAKLRDEILQAGGEPTWDDLTNNLPFLDAVACEILRLHPPLPELQRMAAEDDVLPLTEPLETASGVSVEGVFVRKGTVISVPIKCINRSATFWGPDAKSFEPARWLNATADPQRAQEIQGYRHLLTFSDGARTCLGKGFALAEFKAVLSVLVRNYTFEFPQGPETVIGQHRNILPRPKVEGEKGYAVPLRIRHYVSE